MFFDSGPVCLWTGFGDIDYARSTYHGTGNLGAITPIEETTQLRANGMQIALSGIPSANISLALAEPFRGRRCDIYLACVDSTTCALIADPVRIFSGKMDTMTINDGAENATIAINVENMLIDLDRSRNLVYTDECQRSLYPGDKGFQFVAPLANKVFTWGR